MGLDAESQELTERIRARAAALPPRVETAPTPVPAQVMQPPTGPSPAALQQAARVARYNALVESGLTEEQAEAQLKVEMPIALPVTVPVPPPSTLTSEVVGPAKRKRTGSTLRADLDAAVQRLNLAEGGIALVSERLTTVEGIRADFDLYKAEQDEILTLLATEIAKRSTPLSAGPGPTPSPPLPLPIPESVLDMDAIRARFEADTRVPPAPSARYSFWSSRAGRFISWPARKIWGGLVWVFTSPGSGPYE